MTDHTYTTYARNPLIRLRPYIPGEDLTDIAVAFTVEPREGDMISHDNIFYPIHYINEVLLRAEEVQST